MREERCESDSDTSVTEQLDKTQLDDVIHVDSNQNSKGGLGNCTPGYSDLDIFKKCQIERCCCQNLTMIVYFLVSWWIGLICLHWDSS